MPSTLCSISSIVAIFFYSQTDKHRLFLNILLFGNLPLSHLKSLKAHFIKIHHLVPLLMIVYPSNISLTKSCIKHLPLFKYNYFYNIENSLFLQQITAYNNIISCHPLTYKYFGFIYIGQCVTTHYYI